MDPAKRLPARRGRYGKRETDCGDVRMSGAELGAGNAVQDTSGNAHRAVPVGGYARRPGKPWSGVLVGVVIAACDASGLAVIGHLWVLFWVCAGLVILAVPAGKVIGIMDGAGAVERGPSARGPSPAPGHAAHPS
jgi:hypothetical protein